MDRPGGVQVHVRDTSAALAELGHKVTIISPNVGGEGRVRGREAPNVRDLRLGRAHSVRFSGTKFEVSLASGYQHRRLAAALRPGRFDVVHYHSLWTPALPFQAFACSRGPSVVTFHDTPPDSLTGQISRAVLRAASGLLAPHIDEIIAVSEAPRGHLQAPPDRAIWVMPPCTDLRRFAPEPERSARPPGQPVTILFVGRLEPRKGVMLLLESYRRLCADGLDVRLVIAGDGGEEPALRRFAGQHRLPGVSFIGRFDAADAPGLYAACDIACAPSPYGESFGIVVAEAMASGKPVVAAANSGYRTLLTGEAAELLAPPGDAITLYDRLKRLASDPQLRARLGAWGQMEAQRYDCRSVAPKLLDIYRRAMASPMRAITSRGPVRSHRPDLIIDGPEPDALAK